MKEQLLTTLENSRSYTFAVAEMMPEKEYNFKPADELWNFRELLHHIAYGIEWWQDNFVKMKKTEWDQPAAKTSKKEVLTYLDQAYASLKETICKGRLGSEAVNGF